MAQQHKQIFRDNFALINDSDLITLIRYDYNDQKIEEFIVKQNSFDIMFVKNGIKKLHNYLTDYVIKEIGLLFANAYKTKNYDEIEKYILDNNIVPYDITIIHSKNKMEYILKETIQDHLNVNKYIIKTDLRQYFIKVLPYVLKKGLVQYINDFFIANN